MIAPGGSSSTSPPRNLERYGHIALYQHCARLLLSCHIGVQSDPDGLPENQIWHVMRVLTLPNFLRNQTRTHPLSRLHLVPIRPSLFFHLLFKGQSVLLGLCFCADTERGAVLPSRSPDGSADPTSPIAAAQSSDMLVNLS